MCKNNPQACASVFSRANHQQAGCQNLQSRPLPLRPGQKILLRQQKHRCRRVGCPMDKRGCMVHRWNTPPSARTGCAKAAVAAMFPEPPLPGSKKLFRRMDGHSSPFPILLRPRWQPRCKLALFMVSSAVYHGLSTKLYSFWLVSCK